jgi:cytochrome P450
MPSTDRIAPNAQEQDELPPTGPLPRVAQTLACRLWPLAYMEHCRARYGDRFTIHPIDMPPLVFLSNPHEVHAVLTASPDVLHPGAGGAVVAPLFGDESFTLQEGKRHMCVRNAILPAFHRRVARAHADTIAAIVEPEVASWPRDSVFSVHDRLRELTLRVIMRTVFGEEDAEFTERHSRLLRMLSVMASFLLQEPRLRHLPGWRTTWSRFLRQREEVEESIFALIAERRHAGRHGEDLLGVLLTARNLDGALMSDRQVRDNLVSILIAGHETTASELAWAFQLLAHNPAVQERLVSEIDGDCSGDDGGYLTATIQEVLRRRPVFPFAAPRAVAQPLEIGSWTYRPPTRLLACIYLLHHNPALYPDPHAFRPERFLGTPPSSRLWLPWGGGRKTCLGQHLALLEMRTVLRATLATGTILPASARIERPRWRTVMVTPHAGSQIILRARRSVPIGTPLFQSERIPGYLVGQPS